MLLPSLPQLLPNTTITIMKLNSSKLSKLMRPWTRINSLFHSNQNSHSLNKLKPEEMPMPLLPRLLPSRTSKKHSLLEFLRDLMMDNHSLKLPERWKPSKECSHKLTIWKEDSVSCNQLSQFSKTPSKPSKRSLMSEEWERSEKLIFERTIRLHDVSKPHASGYWFE